jgi:hypothetical protein
LLNREQLTEELRRAVVQFWDTRSLQGKAQGNKSGQKDAGNRALVTGGKQMNGFVSLFARLIESEGIPRSAIHFDDTTLPGYYRPEKDWDLVVVHQGRLIATIEFKSHVGPSFGNNFNNRVEEALGNATDLNTAYREGAFSPSSKPWLGYMMLLEHHPKSIAPVRLKGKHFPALSVFQKTSYFDRYKLFCTRLIRERLYDSTCFIASSEEAGTRGEYIEPLEELSFLSFATSLQSKLVEAVRRSGAK